MEPQFSLLVLLIGAMMSLNSAWAPDPGLEPDLDTICARNLFGRPGAIIFFKDLQSRFIRVSVDCAQLAGRTPAEMVGLTDFDLTDHAHASALLADERRIIATGLPMIAKEEVDRLANRPGTWVETSKFPLRDADGTIVGTFGISRDVSRWELAEKEIKRVAKESADAHAELMRVEDQLRAVLNGSTDAIAKYDAELRYQYINPAGERFRGATLCQLTGRTDRESGMAVSALEVFEPALARVLETGEPDDVEFSVQSRKRSENSKRGKRGKRGKSSKDGEGGEDGPDAWFHVSLSPDRDYTGAVVGVLTSMRDITEIKRTEQALAQQAMHDSLTGLANRYLLTDRLGEALARMERHPGRLVLFFIDLDHFKEVNDTYGHDVGDRVLVDVAHRLRDLARREDTVARLGGDEFIMLCDRVTPRGDVHEIAERIVQALARDFDDGAVSFGLSASVGAVVTDDPQTNTSTLLRAADAAMYQAKAAGRHRFEIHDPTATGLPS